MRNNYFDIALPQFRCMIAFFALTPIRESLAQNIWLTTLRVAHCLMIFDGVVRRAKSTFNAASSCTFYIRGNQFILRHGN